MVREHFLQWLPDDIAEVEDKGHLNKLDDMFNPHSQPQTLEEKSCLQFLRDAMHICLKL